MILDSPSPMSPPLSLPLPPSPSSPPPAPPTPRDPLPPEGVHEARLAGPGAGTDAYLPAAIAHEVNNLLMVLVGNLDLLVSELPDTESARECVREMRGAVERGTALTRRVLALAPTPPLPPA